MEKVVGMADDTTATIIGTMLRFMINLRDAAEGSSGFMNVATTAFGVNPMRASSQIYLLKFIIRSLRGSRILVQLH
jgi:hypothetical protein